MLEGIYFQFPKLGFLLFFFMACEALCPLRTNALYFPGTMRFGEVGVKPALWMWILKWAMIGLFIVAVMSPVRDKEITYQGGGGYDILLILDPAAIDERLKERVNTFVEKRPNDAIALWVPGESEVSVPLTYDHAALASILSQISRDKTARRPEPDSVRYFKTASGRVKWSVVFSDDPDLFIPSLPVGTAVSIAPERNFSRWIDAIHRDHPPISRMYERRYVDYYYLYPLFLGFIAMLGYLYGRNQKGLK